jgi:hypothetical protein
MAVAQVGDIVPSGEMAKDIQSPDPATGIGREEGPVLNEKNLHFKFSLHIPLPAQCLSG